MKVYLSGTIKGSPIVHLFDDRRVTDLASGIAVGAIVTKVQLRSTLRVQPICGRGNWGRPAQPVTLSQLDVTCRYCKKILYGEEV